MPDGKTITVLGGGVGGLVAARQLRKRLGPENRILLIDKSATHRFSPSFLWLMTGDRRPEAISRSLKAVEKHGIELVSGEIAAIDPQARSVEVDGRTIEADYMIVALGADLVPSLVPGLAPAGHEFYSLEGAIDVRDTRTSITSGRLVVLICSAPFKCPAAPYEAAMLLEHDLRRRGVRERVSVDVFTPEPAPMGVAGPEMGAAVRGMLEKRGIGFHPKLRVTRADGASHTLQFEDSSETKFDYLVYVPPHRAPEVVVAAGLTGETGWIAVDRNTMQTRFERVYAVGDVTTIPLSMGLPLPKAGTFAHGQARAVAATIAAKIAGGDETAFNGHGTCFIEVGRGKAGMGSGDFYAEPRPVVKLRKPGRLGHMVKVLFEKWWFRRWL